MTRVDQIEADVAELSAEELRRFSAWFEEFYAKRVDDWLEQEVASGRFDEMAEQALRDDEEGRCTEL